MQTHFRAVGNKKGGRLRLLRRYGWGVPTEERVLSSATSAVTLMLQDEFLPFETGSSGLSMRAFRFHLEEQGANNFFMQPVHFSG